jgi:hypothetical protein
MTLILLMIFINRSLFVTPVEVPNSSGIEINSVLEVIIHWAEGGYNDVDEDGDCPGNYDVAPTFQPLPNQNQINTNFLMYPSAANQYLFCLINEAMISSGYYGTIDQPPEMV